MTTPKLSELFPIVREAGALILDAASRDLDVKKKGDSDFVTNIDLAVQNLIRERLSALAPDIAFLSEEGCDTVADGAGAPYWVLDPIDGTMNFIRGIPHCSVSLALVRDGVTVLGIVYAPNTDEMFYAERGGGAFLRNTRLRVTENEELKNALIGIGTAPYYKPDTAECFEIYRRLFLESVDLRRLGSAAIDICYVAAGRFDAYYEYMLSIWDYAAARLILEEAGGRLTNFENIPTANERKSPVLASNSLLHEKLLNIINN